MPMLSAFSRKLIGILMARGYEVKNRYNNTGSHNFKVPANLSTYNHPLTCPDKVLRGWHLETTTTNNFALYSSWLSLCKIDAWFVQLFQRFPRQVKWAPDQLFALFSQYCYWNGIIAHILLKNSNASKKYTQDAQ